MAGVAYIFYKWIDGHYRPQSVEKVLLTIFF